MTAEQARLRGTKVTLTRTRETVLPGQRADALRAGHVMDITDIQQVDRWDR